MVPPEPPIIEARGLAKRYGRLHVLRGASIEARAGQLVAIVGENGGGKSTLLKILAGVEAASSGEVRCRGALGYCPQESVLYPYLTPDEHFELFGGAIGLGGAATRDRSTTLAERFGFTAHRRRVIQALSGGTRQKVNLALALLGDPDVVLLDEPYAGLDVETYRHLLNWMEEAKTRRRCIVLVTHILFEHALFDAVFHLREGVLHATAC